MARDGLEIVVEALQLRSSYLALDPLDKVMSRRKLPTDGLTRRVEAAIRLRVPKTFTILFSHK